MRLPITSWTKTLAKLGLRCSKAQKPKDSESRSYRAAIENLEPRQLLTTVTWNGNGSTSDFDDGGNWVGGVAPGSGDKALFDAPTSPVTDTVVVDADITVADIEVKDVAITFDIDPNKTLTVTNDVVIGYYNTDATVEVTGDGDLQVDGELTMYSQGDAYNKQTLTPTDPFEGGNLLGDGTIVGDVDQQGVLSPAGPGTVGTLTVDGDVDMHFLNFLDRSVLEIDITSTGNDVLDVDSVDLDGYLEIDLEATYTPDLWTPNHVGDYFSVLQSSSDLSAGDTFRTPNIQASEDFAWRIIYDRDDKTLDAELGSTIAQPWIGNGKNEVILIPIETGNIVIVDDGNVTDGDPDQPFRVEAEGTSSQGSWYSILSHSSTTAPPYAYDNDAYATLSGRDPSHGPGFDDDNDYAGYAEWELTGLTPGSTQEVYLTYPDVDRNSLSAVHGWNAGVTYTIYDGDTKLDTIEDYDQDHRPDDLVYENFPWERLGTYTTQTGSIVVRMEGPHDVGKGGYPTKDLEPRIADAAMAMEVSNFVPTPNDGNGPGRYRINVEHPGASGEIPSAYISSRLGVRYSDGQIAIPIAGGLESNAHGQQWDDTAQWVNIGELADPDSGNGVAASQAPRLHELSSTTIVMTSAESMQFFDLVSGTWTARYFAQTSLTHDDTADEFILVDTFGGESIFNDFDVADEIQGRLKSHTDGGDNATVTTYDIEGRISSVTRETTVDSVTYYEKYTHTYVASGDNEGKKEKVKLERKEGAGSWETIRSTKYTYYDSTDSYGNVGDVQLVTTLDASDTEIGSKYFRYYTKGESGGNVYDMKYSFTADSYARLKDEYATPSTATDAQVAPYADTYMEYDTQGRITKVIQAREGASDGGSGTGATHHQGVYTYDYYTSDNDEGVNKWKTRTTETLPDGNQNIVYANSSGQTMLSVLREDPGGTERDWITFLKYDSDGRLILKANPSAVTGFDESKEDLLNETAGNYQYLSDSAGLINISEYYTSTTATTSVAGGVDGYLWKRSIKNGETGTAIPQTEVAYIKRVGTYDTGTDDDRTIYLTASVKTFSDTAGLEVQTTSHAYTFFTGTTQVESITTTLPVVSTSENGSGSTTVSTTQFNDEFARPIWLKDADGFLTYIEYDPVTGQEIKRIADVDSTETSDFANLPSGWSTPSGGGLHLITETEVDAMGRPTKVTAPNGKVTYTIYKDADHEVRTYDGWTGTSAVMPTRVDIENFAEGYTDTIIMSATPNHSGGAPTGTETISGIESLTRTYRSDAGQVTHVDAYYDYTGLTYPSAGTEGTHFLRTEYEYDDRGRQVRAEEPNGTIRRTVYDTLGRVESVWIGTDDGTNWSPSSPGDMEKIESNLYDDLDDDGDSDIGDSNLSRKTTYADGTTSYVTKYEYDFRNRLTDERGPDGIATKKTYDNRGNVTQEDTYADADSDFVIDANEQRMQTKSFYNDRQQVYRSQEFEVDQSTGTVGDALTTNYWFNERGNQVKQEGPNGLFTKTIYDGAGRVTTQLTSIDSGDSTFAHAQDADGDTVIKQTDTFYDASGLIVTVAHYEREEDDTTSTGLLDGSNSYRNVKVAWYDDADRKTHTAFFGIDPDSYVFDATTNLIKDTDGDGIPNEAEGTAREPNPVSGDWIGKKTEYDDAGRAYRVTNNRGFVNQTVYDLMGRKIKDIENYADGIVIETEDADTDRTTEYIYSLTTGLLTTVRGYNPKGSGNGVEQQDTTYLYESDINASWRTNEIYPDSSDTDSTGTDQIETEYDWLGRRTKVTDQRGVIHEFVYDTAGRLSEDKVTNTTLPSGVDGAVRRIVTAFDDAGRTEYVTSYDGATGGSIVNQVQYVYNDYQLVSEIKQAHGGAVTGSTPSISYHYSDGASGGEAAYVRLDSIDYPDGRTVYYIYPSSGIGDALNRVEAIAHDSSGTTRFVEYEYVGETRVVTKTYPDVSGDVIQSYGASGTYDGWNRFGSVVEQKWTDGTTPTPNVLDHYTYEYDNNTNRTLRDNELQSSLDEDYTYDDLDRLTDTDRNGADYQDWSLDSLGNWESVTDSGGTETRTHNDANEISGITNGGVAPTYDAAGNMTSGPDPANPSQRLHYTYDAWNRLVEVQDDNAGNPDTTLADFEYDGRNYRIEKTVDGILQAYYYNDSQQVVETREDGDTDPLEQFVWDKNAHDSPVLFFRDSDTDGTVDETLYYTTDANGNVTALIDASTGNVVERYHYDPYGKALIYDASWNTRSSSSYDNPYLYAGRRLDTESGFYYMRARYYDPQLGRFINRDPAKYIDGMNLYQYVQGGVPNYTDPTGLARFIPGPDTKMWAAERGRDFGGYSNLNYTVTGSSSATISIVVGARIAADGQINGIGEAFASGYGKYNKFGWNRQVYARVLSKSRLIFEVVGVAGNQFIKAGGYSRVSVMTHARAGWWSRSNNLGALYKPVRRFNADKDIVTTVNSWAHWGVHRQWGVRAESHIEAEHDLTGSNIKLSLSANGWATHARSHNLSSFHIPYSYTIGPVEFARGRFPWR